MLKRILFFINCELLKNINFKKFGILLKSVGKQVRSWSLIVELKSEADSEGN